MNLKNEHARAEKPLRPPAYDLDVVIDALPDLTKIPIKPKEGPWMGSTLYVDSNCGFKGTLGSVFQHLDIHTAQEADRSSAFQADTPQGLVEFQRVSYTSLQSSGFARGRAGRIVLFHGPDVGEELLLRRFVLSKSKKVTDLVLPKSVQLSGAVQIYGHAEFQLAGRTVRWTQIPEGRGFVYEVDVSHDEYLQDFKEIESHLYQANRLFQLLFGEEWGEEFVLQICDRSSLVPQVTQWRRVVPQTDRGYAIIPSSYQDLHTARAQHPDKGIPFGIDFERISPCIAALAEHPDLIFPIDHMLQINRLPLNTRGIMLAVALESLTTIIEKRDGYSTESLIPSAAWDGFHTEVLRLINALPELPDERKGALSNRMRDLNRPTNTAKLKAPFERYGIPLASEELDALEKRNKALHTGRIVRSGPISELTSEDWEKVANLELRLFFIVAKLLLKFMGYQGPVVDWTSLISNKNSPPNCIYI